MALALPPVGNMNNNKTHLQVLHFEARLKIYAMLDWTLLQISVILSFLKIQEYERTIDIVIDEYAITWSDSQLKTLNQTLVVYLIRERLHRGQKVIDHGTHCVCIYCIQHTHWHKHSW